MSITKRGQQGPESYTYDKYKGNWIRIWPAWVTDVKKTWEGVLVWVDTYTIGVAFNYSEDPENVSIIYKDAIRIDLM